MKKKEFLNQIKELTDEDVVSLAISHMLSKNFDENTEVEREKFIEFVSDYINYTKYLNDYMGVICKKYSTEMDEIYKFTCEILEIEWDNKTLFDFRLNRILINTPERVLSIKNDDLLEINLEHLEEELEVLLDSKYFAQNGDSFSKEIELANKNIKTIKETINSL